MTKKQIINTTKHLLTFCCEPCFGEKTVTNVIPNNNWLGKRPSEGEKKVKSNYIVAQTIYTLSRLY